MEKIDNNYLIDAYLSGELEGEMMEQFQIQLSLDKEFENEVKFQKEIHDSLSDYKKSMIKDTLVSYHKQQAYSQKTILHRIRTEAFAAAIISILVIGATIGGFFNFGDNNQSVYDSNFNPDMNKIVVRSAEQPVSSNIDKGIDLFNENNFELALNYFNLETNNFEAILYIGICQMELENFDNAITNLSKVVNNNNNIYIDQAEWYLALSYLRAEKTELALELFTNISKSDGVYQTSALNILNEIKE